jgi:hypothetical protein
VTVFRWIKPFELFFDIFVEAEKLVGMGYRATNNPKHFDSWPFVDWDDDLGDGYAYYLRVRFRFDADPSNCLFVVLHYY